MPREAVQDSASCSGALRAARRVQASSAAPFPTLGGTQLKVCRAICSGRCREHSMRQGFQHVAQAGPTGVLPPGLSQAGAGEQTFPLGLGSVSRWYWSPQEPCSLQGAEPGGEAVLTWEVEDTSNGDLFSTQSINHLYPSKPLHVDFCHFHFRDS